MFCVPNQTKAFVLNAPCVLNAPWTKLLIILLARVTVVPLLLGLIFKADLDLPTYKCMDKNKITLWIMIMELCTTSVESFCICNKLLQKYRVFQKGSNTHFVLPYLIQMQHFELKILLLNFGIKWLKQHFGQPCIDYTMSIWRKWLGFYNKMHLYISDPIIPEGI